MPASVTRISQSSRASRELLPLDQIDPSGLIRRPRAARIAAVAASIEIDGQSEPLEVSPHGPGYRLTKGWVRLEALRALGETQAWVAIKRVANVGERQQRQIDDNLVKEGCTVLDRARYLATAKTLYERANPAAQHGGQRRGDAFQVATSGQLNSFHEFAALRYGVSSRSIRRACMVGETLDTVAADLLADTDWADHQAALETLSRHEPAVQQAAARLLTRDILPAESVADAIAMVLGVAEKSEPQEVYYNRQISLWGRYTAKTKRLVLREVIAADPSLPEDLRALLAPLLSDGGSVGT